MQGATASTARHVVFLNFDSTADPDFLARLVALADERPDAAAVQGLILLDEGPDVFSAGNRAHYLGFSWAPVGSGALLHRAVQRSPRDAARRCSCRATASRTSAASGMPSSCTTRISTCAGAFGCAAGRCCCVLPPGPTTPTSSGETAASTTTWSAAASWCSPRTMGAGRWSRCCRPSVATELGLLAISAVQGWLPQKLRSLASVARALPAARRQRRRVQAGRRIGDGELVPHFETRLGPQFGEAAAALTAPLLPAYARLVRLPALGEAGWLARAATGDPGSVLRRQRRTGGRRCRSSGSTGMTSMDRSRRRSPRDAVAGRSRLRAAAAVAVPWLPYVIAWTRSAWPLTATATSRSGRRARGTQALLHGPSRQWSGPLGRSERVEQLDRHGAQRDAADVNTTRATMLCTNP